MEIAHIDGERARGTQIGVAYELRYALEPGLLRLRVIGGRSARVELGQADFFDLAYSPLFNSLPVWAGLNGPCDYTMLFVDVPSLEVSESRQHYAPLAEGRVRFRSGGFQAELEFDADGIVTFYERLAERLA